MAPDLGPSYTLVFIDVYLSLLIEDLVVEKFGLEGLYIFDNYDVLDVDI